MTTPGDPPRPLQPVVELRAEGKAFAYSVRAPRSKGVIPPSSYKDGGFPTLAACLRDVARALGGDFKRIYVRLDGHCVGERDIVELYATPEQAAAELKTECDALNAVLIRPATITAHRKTGPVAAE